MPRISGVDIPEHKKIVYSLTSIYGIGISLAKKLVAQVGIDPNIRARDLSSDQVAKLQRALDRVVNEGDLRRAVRDNIERLKRIRSYRGMRHAANLPVRGQRTRVNARTNRGKRRTVGSMTKEMAAKLDQAKS